MIVRRLLGYHATLDPAFDMRRVSEWRCAEWMDDGGLFDISDIRQPGS